MMQLDIGPYVMYMSILNRPVSGGWAATGVRGHRVRADPHPSCVSPQGGGHRHSQKLPADAKSRVVM